MSLLRRRVQSADPPFVGDNFASLQATASGSGRLVELYPRDTVRNTLTRIGTWRDRAGVLFPEGSIFFERATDTLDSLSTAAAGPTNDVTSDTPGNHSIGQIVSVWSLTMKAIVAFNRRIDDKAGSVLTLSGAPFTVAIGDLIISANEFGAMGQKSDGALWEPTKANGFPTWSSGLQVDAGQIGDGVFLYFMGNSELETMPRYMKTIARIGVVEAAAGQNSTFGTGFKSTNFVEGVASHCVHFDGLGEWRRGLAVDFPQAPTLLHTLASASATAPGTGEVLQHLAIGDNDDGTNDHHQEHTIGANLTGAFSSCAESASWLGVGGGTNGSFEGMWLLGQVANGGSLRATWREVETRYRNKIAA